MTPLNDDEYRVHQDSNEIGGFSQPAHQINSESHFEEKKYTHSPTSSRKYQTMQASQIKKSTHEADQRPSE